MRYHRVGLRVSAADVAVLRECATELGLKMSAVVRRAVSELHARTRGSARRQAAAEGGEGKAKTASTTKVREFAGERAITGLSDD